MERRAKRVHIWGDHYTENVNVKKVKKAFRQKNGTFGGMLFCVKSGDWVGADR
nr:MAG TPA: DNA REPAIR PROTEIN XRCC4, DNA end joining, double-strand break.3A [Caudoviricetes sp.]